MNWQIRQAIDLKNGYPRPVVYPKALLMPGSDAAHSWEVTITDGGVAVDLSDYSVTADFDRGNDTRVTLAGSKSGNVAIVLFDQSCYAIPGSMRGVMTLTKTGETIPVSEMFFPVLPPMPDTIVVPENVISIPELIAAAAGFMGMTADIEMLAPGETATVDIEVDEGDGHYILHFGIPGASDPLTGKVLVHCGDSISAGPWIDPDPITGIVPTFPVVAGARHGMTVHNTAISGAWLVHTNYHGTPAPYPLIDMIDSPGFLPDSIDYFTIMIGGNDEYGMEGLYDDYCLTNYSALYGACTSAQQAEARAAVPISNYIGLDWHNVNYTWWGCWNLILTYIRTTYPTAIIGIITPLLSDPINDPFQAELRSTLYTIAKKYGCAIRDANNADEWFSWGWTDGIGTAEAAVLKTQWSIDGVHPNAAAHVKMADRYEAWLLDGISGYGREPEYPKYFGEIKTKQGLYDAISDQFNGLFTGRNLATLFPTFASMMEKIGDGTFRNIRPGDYWDATLTGTYRDRYFETCPSGVTYYSDTGLTTAVGTTAQAYNAIYHSEGYCDITIGETTFYVSAAACLGYRTLSVSGFTFRGQIAAINPFIGNYMTKNHVVICGQYLFPNTSAMRRVSAVWYDTGAQNSWLGSFLYATMNDATNGIIRLFDGTVFEDYIYAGAGSGIVFPIEQKFSNSWNAENLIEAGRGKLFLPLEHEVFGSPLLSSRAYGCGVVKQWDLFRDGKDRIRKVIGGTATYDAYWLQSAQEGTPYGFSGVSAKGLPTPLGDNTYWISFPICFVLAVPD